MHITRRYSRRGLSFLALLLLPSLLTACAIPVAPSRHGALVLRSPSCHCRFTYPASWYFQASNGDTSRPILGLSSYDASSADHAPIPATFADVGINWQSDPTGQLYLAAATRNFSHDQARRLTVSSWPATAVAHWTAPRAQGGVYQEHVYVFVPWYQRDYDIWFDAGSPRLADISRLHRTFQQVVRSLTIVPPNAVP